jgi:hypothetical protein
MHFAGEISEAKRREHMKIKESMRFIRETTGKALKENILQK